VYFLFCKENDDTDSVYVGESENVKEHLLHHLRDYQSDNEKYYWTTAVIFVGRDPNKTLIRYLENSKRKILRLPQKQRRFSAALGMAVIRKFFRPGQ
jgi:hypothetical protein